VEELKKALKSFSTQGYIFRDLFT